jgi:PAS domain S-box-containing protein
MPHSQFLHALPDAAILTDPSGVVRGWNDPATQLFGWTAADMIGQAARRAIPVECSGRD